VGDAEEGVEMKMLLNPNYRCSMKRLVLCCGLFLVGFGLGRLNRNPQTQRQMDPHIHYPDRVELVIPRDNASALKFNLSVIRVTENGEIVKDVEADPHLKIGSVTLLSGESRFTLFGTLE